MPIPKSFLSEMSEKLKVYEEARGLLNSIVFDVPVPVVFPSDSLYFLLMNLI